jgi:hypothetical protein
MSNRVIEEIKKEQELKKKVKKLKEGDSFKSYAEMCRTIGVEVKEGRTKKLQEENFKRFFEYEKKGREIRIVKIYENPIPKISERQYDKEIRKILLHMLIRNEETETFFFTRKKLYEYLGLCNKNLYLISNEKAIMLPENKEIKEKIDNISRDYHLTNRDIDIYTDFAKSRIYTLLTRNLNYLKKDFLINWYEKIIYVDIESGKHIEATEKEANIIKDIRRRALIKSGYNSAYMLYKDKEATEQFLEDIGEELEKEIGASYAYPALRIDFTKEYIIDEYCKINDIEYEELELSMEEFSKTKKELSEKVHNNIEKGLESHIKNNSKKEIAYKKAQNKHRHSIGRNEEDLKLLFNDELASIDDEELKNYEPTKIYGQKKLNNLCILFNESNKKGKEQKFETPNLQIEKDKYN